MGQTQPAWGERIMSIRVSCPSCTAIIKAPDAAAGKRAKCPKCGTAIQIPATVALSTAVAERPSASAPLVQSQPQSLAVNEVLGDEYVRMSILCRICLRPGEAVQALRGDARPSLACGGRVTAHGGKCQRERRSRNGRSANHRG